MLLGTFYNVTLPINKALSSHRAQHVFLCSPEHLSLLRFFYDNIVFPGECQADNAV